MLRTCRSVEVPVRWHLIGHLQRNKVRDLDHFALVHSIDRTSIADAVSAFGLARKRSVDALVQVNVAGELTKGGFAPEDLPAEAEQFIARAGLRITGVMTMAPLDADGFSRHPYPHRRRFVGDHCSHRFHRRAGPGVRGALLATPITFLSQRIGLFDIRSSIILLGFFENFKICQQFVS